MIFNDKTGELWSYDINRPINRFDFATGSWSESNPTLLNPEYAQHNAVISPVDSCLYIFGGYGEYRYLNNLIKYSPKTERWDTVSVNDKIPPRYLASAGFISPDSLLIFGGFGHPSGMQELGPGSYYDLFVLNPSTGATMKICDFKGRPEQMVGSNSPWSPTRKITHSTRFTTDITRMTRGQHLINLISLQVNTRCLPTRLHSVFRI